MAFCGELKLSKKKKPPLQLELLDQLGKEALLEVCKIVSADTTRLMKGGITCQLSCNQMKTKIRQQTGCGIFPDRRERLSFFLENWESTELDPVIEDEPKPEDVVRELIEDVRNALDRLNDVQLLELISEWLQNPQGYMDCYEELDTIAEELGFSYEEIESELILVSPSPLALSKSVSTMSDAIFYHTVIALAGMALNADQFSNSPTMLNDGYDFLRELTRFLGHRASSITSLNH